MNIKYNFNQEELVSNPRTSNTLFKDSGAGKGLYQMATGESLIDNFRRNLDLINQRICGVQRNLAYWDLYKIVSQVTSPSQLDAVFSALIPGQACVINCASFQSGTQSFHRGDIIVKMLDNEAAYIPTVSSGLYKPSKIYSLVTKAEEPDYYYYYWAGNTTYTPGFYYVDSLDISMANHILSICPEGYTKDSNIILQYSYMNTEPTSAEQTVSYPIPVSDPNNSFVYGISQSISANATSATFTNITFTPTGETARTIRPIIKFFTTGGEELDIHFTAALSNNTWTVTWTALPFAIIMQVK